MIFPQFVLQLFYIYMINGPAIFLLLTGVQYFLQAGNSMQPFSYVISVSDAIHSLCDESPQMHREASSSSCSAARFENDAIQLGNYQSSTPVRYFKYLIIARMCNPQGVNIV